MMGIVAQQAMMNVFPGSYLITVGTSGGLGPYYGVALDSSMVPVYGDVDPNPATINPNTDSWIYLLVYKTGAANRLELSASNYTFAQLLSSVISITVSGTTLLVADRFDGDDDGAGGFYIEWSTSNLMGTTVGDTRTLVINYA